MSWSLLSTEFGSCPLSRWCYLTISSSVVPLLLPSVFPSITVFSSESTLHIRWATYWSFSFSIRPSNEYSGLIFFRFYWFDLLAVNGTPKSLLQHRNLKASILRCSAFFMDQHPFMTTRKIINLTVRTFVSKVMSLLFNMMSRFVITFLPRSKCLLIAWLQSPSVMILETKKRKSASAFTFSPSICHEVMGPDAMILVFFLSDHTTVFSICLVYRQGHLIGLNQLSLLYHLSFASMVNIETMRWRWPPTGMWSEFLKPCLKERCPGKPHNWKCFVVLNLHNM